MASIQTAMRSRGAIDVRRCAFSSHWTASPPKRKEEASYGKDCTDIINESARHRGYSSLSTSLPPIHGLCFRAPISQNRHACSRRVLYYSTTSSGPRRTHWPHTAMLLQQKQCNNSTLYGYSSNHRRSFASGKKRDLYDVLGVAKSADKGTLKKAYFQLAKKHHPDTNQGDEKAMDKFKEVTAAYEVLSDEKQRGLYDQFGHAGVDPNFQASAGGGAGGNPFGPGFQGFDFGDGSFHFTTSSTSSSQEDLDPEELFDMFFGGGQGGGKKNRRNRGPRRGADLQMQVRVSFRDAVFGTKQDLNLRYQTVNRDTGETQTKERTVPVDIPAGIDNGMNLRLQGQGAEGDPGAPAGNLLVQVVVEEDSYFVRDGYDVHTEVPISISQAVLGGTVDVRTLNGEVELKIPKSCQPDAKLMMRAKGIQQLHGSRKGNHVVHLKLVIPKEISTRQEALLREFDEESRVHGLGISGRIAHAAGSAFEKMFGPKDKKKKEAATETVAAKEESDDEENNKKQAAQ